ncbi:MULTISPECIES: glycosyltransferase family 2 protein [Asticcacaulis]|uniref:glycosyltransferase family 2 protein n=1 Tax=Asticcacaulis TaxID=76890 RepID=UPI001AE155DC|nr:MULTISPECIES: glycosyltransferase family 2 protein [Asticcacaulis]MBP2157870.1 GT2 family glycosyltransferase [Asticcacaulis solisilvae]MDR6798915.1 GT2 family glycosyltransferase [Asticcacaulis sp. BE141]
MTETLTAVVVTYNSAAVLPACLTALHRAGVRAIVVDNGSTDDSAVIAAAMGAIVIRNRRNLGYGRANNIGVRAATTEHVLICNPDATVSPEAVSALLEAATTYPEAGLYAPRIIEPDGREYFKTGGFLNPGPKASESPVGDVCTLMVQGSCLMMRRDLFLDMGGFDENIFLYYEDDDLCRRLSDRKRAIVYVAAARVWHLRGGSSALSPGLIALCRYHQSWSKVYIARKYGLPSPALALMAVNAVKYVGALLSGNSARQERYSGSFRGAAAALRSEV